jgi:hypothetical protein
MHLAFRLGRAGLNIVRLSTRYGDINSYAAGRLRKLHFKKKKNAACGVTIYYTCRKVMEGKNSRRVGVRSIEFARFASIVKRQSFDSEETT